MKSTGSLQEKVFAAAREAVGLLCSAGKTVATAESCTGGMLSAYITSVSGASSVLGVGITAYSADAKQRLIGVKESTILENGTVSRKTAAEMAVGVRRLSGADIGLSVTGVAGPGVHEGKPAGTVYIALADEKQVKVTKLTVESADRDTVRHTACLALLTTLTDFLKEGK